MPVPKRKTSKARRDKRSANKHIRPQAVTSCANCEYPLSPHAACAECGYYKGKKVLRTKLERTLSRTQVRTAKQAKTPEPGHEGHEHGEEQK
jgi:large subunit ribosomal protein L32